MWSRVDDLLFERKVALVDVREDGFVLLRQKSDEVDLAVVVQVDRNDVNRPSARIDRVGRERRLGGVRGPILED
jgi:hypothetical protein